MRKECHVCHRPQGDGWRTCAWCGTARLAAKPSGQWARRLAGSLLLLQALSLVGATITLAVEWALQGWSVEQGQTLGIIWVGVVISVSFIAWLGTNLARPAESGAVQIR